MSSHSSRQRKVKRAYTFWSGVAAMATGMITGSAGDVGDPLVEYNPIMAISFVQGIAASTVISGEAEKFAAGPDELGTNGFAGGDPALIGADDGANRFGSFSANGSGGIM
jgi:hypothetical protein